MSSEKFTENQNISLLQKLKSGVYLSPSRPTQRASAVVTDEGRVAVDAGNAGNERHESVRQRRVVLTPRSWRLRWQQYMAHRGDHVISRKAIAQGMSDCLRCPVCSYAQSSTICVRDRGCSAHPAFPAPSEFRGRENPCRPRAQCVARSRTHIQCRPRACGDPVFQSAANKTKGRRVLGRPVKPGR